VVLLEVDPCVEEPWELVSWEPELCDPELGEVPDEDPLVCANATPGPSARAADRMPAVMTCFRYMNNILPVLPHLRRQRMCIE
jgi:hypothetical protein